MKKTIERLLNSDINTHVIATKSNVNYSIIHRLRSGERKIGNLKLDTAEKLYELQKEMDKMEELKNKMLKRVKSGEIESIEALYTYFIDIDRADDFTIDFAEVNKVEYKDKEIYEVVTHSTIGVTFKDEVNTDNLNLLYDAWLEEDQQTESQIEYFYFENEQDAKDYIVKVLDGYETFEQCAKEIGIIE